MCARSSLYSSVESYFHFHGQKALSVKKKKRDCMNMKRLELDCEWEQERAQKRIEKVYL